MAKNRALSFASVRKMGLALPEVRESGMHGNQALEINGRLLTCPAIHKSAEPNSIVVSIDPETRKILLDAHPEAFYVTEHYKRFPTILVRLDRVKRGPLEDLLAAAWRFSGSRAKEPRPKHERMS